MLALGGRFEVDKVVLNAIQLKAGHGVRFNILSSFDITACDRYVVENSGPARDVESVLRQANQPKDLCQMCYGREVVPFVVIGRRVLVD